MEGEGRQSLTGLNSTAGDEARRRKKELLLCHTFGESHRKGQNRSRGEERQVELLTSRVCPQERERMKGGRWKDGAAPVRDLTGYKIRSHSLFMGGD